MDEAKPRGALNWTAEQYARFLGVAPGAAFDIIKELQTTGVSMVTQEGQQEGAKVVQTSNQNGRSFSFNTIITVASRRMLREEKERENNRLRQLRFREKSECNADMLPNVTEKYSASSSSSSSSSSLNLKENLRVLGCDVKVWSEWIEVRKKIRKPLTDRGIELAIAKLQKLKVEGNDPTEVLEQSIFNSWQGLFPIDKAKQARNSGQPLMRPDLALKRRMATQGGKA